MRRTSVGTTAVALSVALLLGVIATPAAAQEVRDLDLAERTSGTRGPNPPVVNIGAKGRRTGELLVFEPLLDLLSDLVDLIPDTRYSRTRAVWLDFLPDPSTAGAIARVRREVILAGGAAVDPVAIYPRLPDFDDIPGEFTLPPIPAIPAIDPGGLDQCIGALVNCIHTCITSGGFQTQWVPIDPSGATGWGLCYRPPKWVPLVPSEPPPVFEGVPGEAEARALLELLERFAAGDLNGDGRASAVGGGGAGKVSLRDFSFLPDPSNAVRADLTLTGLPRVIFSSLARSQGAITSRLSSGIAELVEAIAGFEGCFGRRAANRPNVCGRAGGGGGGAGKVSVNDISSLIDPITLAKQARAAGAVTVQVFEAIQETSLYRAAARILGLRRATIDASRSGAGQGAIFRDVPAAVAEFIGTASGGVWKLTGIVEETASHATRNLRIVDASLIPDARGNVVQGNYIGTNASGATRGPAQILAELADSLPDPVTIVRLANNTSVKTKGGFTGDESQGSTVQTSRVVSTSSQASSGSTVAPPDVQALLAQAGIPGRAG
jgi:hypothetical protein